MNLKTKFLSVGILIGFLIPPLMAYLFVVLGGMPVATRGEPLPLERWLAYKAVGVAMHRDPDSTRTSPAPPDEMNLVAGAKTYANNCAVCHGYLNHSKSRIAQGMFPQPPQLLSKEENASHEPDGPLYWITRNGIRLTGMPGFADTLSETEIWQVVQVLRKANELPSIVQAWLEAPH